MQRSLTYEDLGCQVNRMWLGVRYIYIYIYSSGSEHYLYHLHYPPVAETGTGEVCELECQD